MSLRMTTGGDGIPEQRRRSRPADLVDPPGPPESMPAAASPVEAEQERLRVARREFAVSPGEFLVEAGM